MGVLLSRLWGLRFIRRRGANPLPSASNSDISGSCDSILTYSTLDSELDQGESTPMSHSNSNSVQLSPSPFHATPIQRLNQDLLLK